MLGCQQQIVVSLIPLKTRRLILKHSMSIGRTSIFSESITIRGFLGLRRNDRVFKLCLKLVGKVRLI
ncbi:hypothetical protein SAM_0645 [Streptococcus agalactiae CJB111]|nr:hypothetical protein SAM_0645 [Streptococcus agalactiae CJB111]